MRLLQRLVALAQRLLRAGELVPRHLVGGAFGRQLAAQLAQLHAPAVGDRRRRAQLCLRGAEISVDGLVRHARLGSAEPVFVQVALAPLLGLLDPALLQRRECPLALGVASRGALLHLLQREAE